MKAFISLVNRTAASHLLVVLIGITWGTTTVRAQVADGDTPGAEVLTRGPVHEAFAGMSTFNAEPGIVVAKTPPAPIEEIPPDERPAGDNVTWIPGYWAWDDERNDFLWVSGIWRALPPGRAWTSGYWGETPQGHQWMSGYWADAAVAETTYLPPPPATVEAGPNVTAPSPDYEWSPGCWVWYGGRYAWRPGYWTEGRADWDWSPAHYVWTPRGYIFVDGYWDYPVERRGVLFAPVYFERGVYSRRGYSYSPTIVIDIGGFSDNLFLRPRYNHYYFGDYYAASYAEGGFYTSFSFRSGRYGYDPIFSQERWEHRSDRDWEHRTEASYQYRRDNEAARPPRTWAAERNIRPSAAGSQQGHVTMAMPMTQLAARKDNPEHFQPVASAERQKLAQRGEKVQQSRDQRRTVESTHQPGEASAPVKVQLPKSPIVARPVSQMKKDEAPPKTQHSTRPDPNSQPQAESPAHQPNVAHSNPQTQSHQPETEQQPALRQKEAMPHEQQPTPGHPQFKELSAPAQNDTPARDRQVQPQIQPRAKAVATPSPEAVPREQPPVAAHTSPQIEKPVAVTHEPVRPAQKIPAAQIQKHKIVPPGAESKPETRPDDGRSSPDHEQAQPRADGDHEKKDRE